MTLPSKEEAEEALDREVIDAICVYLAYQTTDVGWFDKAEHDRSVAALNTIRRRARAVLAALKE